MKFDKIMGIYVTQIMRNYSEKPFVLGTCQNGKFDFAFCTCSAAGLPAGVNQLRQSLVPTQLPLHCFLHWQRGRGNSTGKYETLFSRGLGLFEVGEDERGGPEGKVQNKQDGTVVIKTWAKVEKVKPFSKPKRFQPLCRGQTNWP